jgi:hypothetical protein
MAGTATCYGQDGPSSKAGGNKIFLTHPNRPRSPPSPLYNGYRVCPLGKEGDGWRTTRPFQAAVADVYIYTSAYSLDLGVT